MKLRFNSNYDQKKSLKGRLFAAGLLAVWSLIMVYDTVQWMLSIFSAFVLIITVLLDIIEVSFND